MRYERKYRIKGKSVSEILYLLKNNPFNFKSHYPDRFVNSIYLDTLKLENYNDNQIGIANRKKYRIRWYGYDKSNIENPKLEKKIKIGWVGKKETYNISSFKTNTRSSFSDYFFNGTSNLPANIFFELKNLTPVLMNSYMRIYLISFCKRFRATIDTQQNFYSTKKSSNSVFKKVPHRDESIILEIKYDVNYDLIASQVTNSFPYSISKNSKYVNGINYIRKYL